MQHVYMSAYNMSVAHLIQEAQLSQRGCAMLRVTEYFAKSLKVIGNGTIPSIVYEFLFLSIVTMAISCVIFEDLYHTCNMLLHYLVKVENPKMLLILTASSTNC